MIQGSREDSYGNNNMDSSRGVPRSPYGGASEDNHGPQRSTESSSEDQSNVNRHPIAGRIDQTNRSTTGRENASFRNHQHPDELWKTGGMSENIQKDVTTSVSSVVEPSRVVLPIKLPDPPRSHKATTSTTSTEAQAMRLCDSYVLLSFDLHALLSHSFPFSPFYKLPSLDWYMKKSKLVHYPE